MGTPSMVRPVTPEQREDLLAPASPHALLAFVTVRHRLLIKPLRVVSDPTDFVVGGDRYTGIPFEIAPVTDEDQHPRTEVRMQNVDRRIGEALRTLPSRAVFELEIRSTADFDLSVVPRVEAGPSAPVYAFRHFDLVDVTVTPLEITGTLLLRDYAQAPWPARSATQSRCPALYR